MQKTRCSFLNQATVYTIIIVHNICDFIMLPSCRFSPSCSIYIIEAIKKHGVFPGLFQGLKRIARCRPGYLGGPDTVK